MKAKAFGLLLSVGLAVQVHSAAVCYGEVQSYICSFNVSVGPNGVDRDAKPLSLTFIRDVATKKVYMTANNGGNEVTEIPAEDGGRTWIEITSFGTVQVTAVAPNGDAVHSRHTRSPQTGFMASQWYGACTTLGPAVDDPAQRIAATCVKGQDGDCFKLGVAFDEANATKFAKLAFQKICGPSHALSCLRLGQIFMKEEQYDAALRSFEVACAAGNFVGCYGAGLIVSSGNVKSRAPASAQGLFVKACKGGVKEACSKVRAQ